MDFGGRYLFAAPRERVWAALNDAALLKSVIPGCETLEWTGPTTLDLKLKVHLGLIHPTFSGDLTLSDIRPAERYTLSGKGRGVASLAHAAADITLSGVSGGTELAFDAAGSADGTIMKLGKAVIGNSAQKVIDGFFGAIGERMGVNVTTLPR